jgi:hypothetical protein
MPPPAGGDEVDSTLVRFTTDLAFHRSWSVLTNAAVTWIGVAAKRLLLNIAVSNPIGTFLMVTIPSTCQSEDGADPI